jgi:TonB family protein
LIIRNVELKKSEVKIVCDRIQIVRDRAGNLGLGEQQTRVNLNFTLAGEPAALVGSFRDAVFFPSIEAALAAVPKAFQQAIPPKADNEMKPVTPPATCDCADTRESCHVGVSPGMKPPKVLSSVSPDLPDEAARNKVNGDVQIDIQINETGAIVDEWLVRGFGYGMDEAAARAVRQYKFSPATCHDKPVTVVIFVDVNFATG